jgi:hypothetical protein
LIKLSRFEANQPRRGPRNAAASQALQMVFNATAASGGHGGTQSSAGSYDKRVGSATKNPR